MNIQVEWDNSEKTIIVQTYPLYWDWQDVRDSREQSRLLMDSVLHKVHFITNMQRSPRIPGNYMAEMQILVEDVHPNTGLSVIVSSNPLVKDLVYLFSADQGGIDFEYRFAVTVDEARQILHKWTGC